MNQIGLAKISEFQDTISRLDRKASFLIAAVALLIGLSERQAGFYVVSALSCGTLSLLSAVSTIWPRTPAAGKDLSWVTIAQQDESITARDLAKTGGDETIAVMATQLKVLAQICRSKVTGIRLSAFFLVLMCGAILCSAIAEIGSKQ